MSTDKAIGYCRVCGLRVEGDNVRLFEYGSRTQSDPYPSQQHFALCPKHDTELHAVIYRFASQNDA